MNQIYKKENFIVIPVCKDFLVVNINKVFKEGHAHVKSIEIARLLIDLALEKRLPKNPYFVESLVRISINKDYINDLKKFKEDGLVDYKELMEASSYKRHKGAIKQVR
ncbi:hypothetical protein ACJDU8_15690 [Clostridium sp. WILCCON 0269]|uniref:Uncharacterized protein n=1 Tax=Candidatus Clostridium eludens TaxID=3381663 RepID=A0ABW8SP98_9CLOT